MKAIRFLSLIISIIFLVFGLQNVITLQNLGGYMAVVIGFFLLLYFIFYNKIIELVQSTVLGKAIATIVLIFAIFFIFVEALIIFGEIKSYNGDCDAVIVLGSGLFGDTVSLNLQYRLDRAIEYLKEHPNTLVVVSGGQGTNELIPEAVAMKKYLVERGIDENMIIEENQSTNTNENFEFSKKILDEKFGRTDYVVAYVTSNFHVFRSGQIAKRQGLMAYGIVAKDVWYLVLTDHLRELVSVINMWVGIYR